MSKEELERLEVLKEWSGAKDMTAFMLKAAFAVKLPKDSGDDTFYPGWEILQQGRRDLGILIGKDPVPLKMKSPVMLFPEDREYSRFLNL